MTWRSPRDTRARAAARLVLLLAAVYAAFASTLPAHALEASRPVCVAACDDASAPSSPAPLHDESDCPVCRAGGSVAPAAQPTGRALPLCVAALPGDARLVQPRVRHASPEAARAPPRALFA